MSDSNPKNTVTLKVIGLIGNGHPYRMPVTLPEVPVQLIPHGADQYGPEISPIKSQTDCAGMVTFHDVPLKGPYKVKVLFDQDKSGTSFESEETVNFLDHTKHADPIYVNLVGLTFTLSMRDGDLGTDIVPVTNLPYGRNVHLTLTHGHIFAVKDVVTTIAITGMNVSPGVSGSGNRKYSAYTRKTGPAEIRAAIGFAPPAPPSDTPVTVEASVLPPEPTTIEGGISVGMRRTTSRFTEDVPLWVSIRRSTEALNFDNYFDFMNWVFCNDSRSANAPDNIARKSGMLADTAAKRFLPFTDTDAYRNIKIATEAFVMANCGVFSNFSDGDADYVQGQISFPERISPDDLRQRLNTDYLHSLSTPGVKEGVLPYLAVVRRKLIDQRIKEMDIGDVILGSPFRPPANVTVSSVKGLRSLACSN